MIARGPRCDPPARARADLAEPIPGGVERRRRVRPRAGIIHLHEAGRPYVAVPQPVLGDVLRALDRTFSTERRLRAPVVLARRIRDGEIASVRVLPRHRCWCTRGRGTRSGSITRSHERSERPRRSKPFADADAVGTVRKSGSSRPSPIARRDEGLPAVHAARTCSSRSVGRTGWYRERHRGGRVLRALLKDLGCSSNSALLVELFGADDIELKRREALTERDHLAMALLTLRTLAGSYEPLPLRLRRLISLARGGADRHRIEQLRCERGADVARRAGFEIPCGGDLHRPRSLDVSCSRRAERRGLPLTTASSRPVLPSTCSGSQGRAGATAMLRARSARATSRHRRRAPLAC